MPFREYLQYAVTFILFVVFLSTDHSALRKVNQRIRIIKETGNAKKKELTPANGRSEKAPSAPHPVDECSSVRRFLPARRSFMDPTTESSRY